MTCTAGCSWVPLAALCLYPERLFLLDTQIGHPLACSSRYGHFRAEALQIWGGGLRDGAAGCSGSAKTGTSLYSEMQTALAGGMLCELPHAGSISAQVL